MTDWAVGMESRNHDITRALAGWYLPEILRQVSFLAAVAGILVFYLSVRGQIIQAGYQNQQLVAEEKILVRESGHLILEEQTLKNPARIDAMARDLGLIYVQANQRISIPTRDTGAAGSYLLALAQPPNSSAPAKLRATK